MKAILWGAAILLVALYGLYVWYVFVNYIVSRTF